MEMGRTPTVASFDPTKEPLKVFLYVEPTTGYFLGILQFRHRLFTAILNFIGVIWS